MILGSIILGLDQTYDDGDSDDKSDSEPFRNNYYKKFCCLVLNRNLVPKHLEGVVPGRSSNVLQIILTVELVSEDAREDSYSKNVSGEAIQKCFLDFYASRGHKVLSNASLVPEDPTVLLNIAGMLQFKHVFLGKVPRQVLCATTAQRFIRTNYLENVGRTGRHHTFFEMLGNQVAIHYETTKFLVIIVSEGFRMDSSSELPSS